MSILFLSLILSSIQHADSHLGSKDEDRTMNGNKGRTSPSATVNPARRPYNTDQAPSLPAGGLVNIPNTPNSVARWAGGFASSTATPLTGAMAQPTMPLMCGPDAAQQATTLDYGSYGDLGSMSDPQQQQQPFPWIGGENNGGVWSGRGAPAGDQRYSSSSQQMDGGF